MNKYKKFNFFKIEDNLFLTFYPFQYWQIYLRFFNCLLILLIKKYIFVLPLFRSLRQDKKDGNYIFNITEHSKIIIAFLHKIFD